MAEDRQSDHPLRVASVHVGHVGEHEGLYEYGECGRRTARVLVSFGMGDGEGQVQCRRGRHVRRACVCHLVRVMLGS